MIRIFSFSIIFAALFITACGKGRTASIEKIKDLELRVENEKDPQKLSPLVYDLQVLYNDFAERFPEDTLAQEYLYRSFDQNQRLNWYDRAVQSADLFLSKYPDSKHAPEVLFNEAFIYDDKLNDDAKAGDLYRKFLEKFPDHELSADAQNSIRFLGLSPEQALQKIEEMNNMADSSAASSGK